MYKADDSKLHEQERDVSKYWKNKNVKIAMTGIENQTVPEMYMPLRVIGYDGASYRSELILKKPHNTYPVVTLVLYYGIDKWDKPINLVDCFIIPDELKSYVNNYKMYTMRTYCAQDKDTNEIFNYFIVENTNFLKLVGDSGTVYNQLSTSLPDYFNPGYLVDDYEEFGQFYCENNGIIYNAIYLPYHGRLEFYEDDGLFYLTQDEDIPNKYYQDDKVFWYSEDEVTGYIKLASESGLIVYSQIKSDVMIRSFDGSLFEFRINDEDNSIILIFDSFLL